MPPIDHRRLLGHMIRHAVPVFWKLLLPSLLVGVAIYHFGDGQPWSKSFLNAAMLLGGMGPVGDMNREIGMILAGVYALFAGLVFLLIAGVMLHPIVLEAVRAFHLEDQSRPRAR